MKFREKLQRLLKNKPELVCADLSMIKLTYQRELAESEECKQEMKALADLLNEHPEIKTLELDSCSIWDPNIKFLAETLKYIEVINLRRNDLTLVSLNALLQNQKIKEIDFRNNHLSKDEQTWNELIANLPSHVTKLDVTLNGGFLSTQIQPRINEKIRENQEIQEPQKEADINKETWFALPGSKWQRPFMIFGCAALLSAAPIAIVIARSTNLFEMK